MASLPEIVVHVLAKDKASLLPMWLEVTLDALDYPRHLVTVLLRTNNNTDRTAELLVEWVQRQVVLQPGEDPAANPDAWGGLLLDATDVPERVERFGVHEWNPERFAVLGRLRAEGVAFAAAVPGRWYVTIDVDNVVRPDTVRRLVELDLPVVAPMLRYAVGPGEEDLRFYANVHHPVDERGYFVASRAYLDLVTGLTTGVVEVDLVHCAYVLRPDVLADVVYDDGSGDHEYVIFSRQLRARGIPQFLANDAVYGALTLSENAAALAAALVDLDVRPVL